MTDAAILPRNGLALRAEPPPPAAARHFAFDEIVKMARSVARSGLFPGITTDEQAITLMFLCESEGLHPMQAMRRFHIIKGRPSMRADAMQAEFQRQGGVIRWDRSDAEECTARFLHAVHAPEPGVTVTVTMAWARAAGLAANESYKRFPDQMLRARAISQGVRMVLPGVVVGIYCPEELEGTLEAPGRPRAIEPPATIPIETPGPGPDLDSRSAVNAAFVPGSVDGGDEPARDPRSKEATDLWGDRVGAHGRDVRNWADLQAGVVKVVRDRIDRHRVDELGLMPLGEKDEPNPWSVLNHMVTATVEANAPDPNPNPVDAHGKRKAIGNGKKAEHLHTLYLKPAWRDWMRAEAREYLGGKLAGAKAAGLAEAGLADAPDMGPEAGSQEPPAGEPGEGKTWAPGRE